MGGSSSQVKLEKVSAKNLVNGDHIVKRGLFRNQHAIYIDSIMGTCVCLDTQSGMITETHITNFCQNQNKLYRANYNNVIRQSTDQIVANAKRFVAREYFSVCCLSSSFNFCFNCSTNRYTTVRYPAVPTLTITDIKKLQQKYDIDNAGDINITKQYETEHQIKISPSKSIVKIKPNSIETSKVNVIRGNNNNNNNNDANENNINSSQETSEEHKSDSLYNSNNDIVNKKGVSKKLFNLINVSKEIKKFEPQSVSKSLKSQDIDHMDPSIELEHITVPLPFVNENQNKNSPSRSLANYSVHGNSVSVSGNTSSNESDMCIIEPEITSSNSNSDEFIPVILK